MKYKKLYVVGFVGENQPALYSNRAWSFLDEGGGIEKMTLPQAKKELKKLSGENGKKAIFKLVPIYKENL